MNEAAVVEYLMTTFPDVETMESYGYDMFFYRDDPPPSALCPIPFRLRAITQ